MLTAFYWLVEYHQCVLSTLEMQRISGNTFECSFLSKQLMKRFKSGKRFPFKLPETIETESKETIKEESVFEVASFAEPRPAPTVRIVPPDWYRYPKEDDDPRMIGEYFYDENQKSYQTREIKGLEKFDDEQRRRNIGEDVPEDWEVFDVWAPDVETRYGWAYVLGGPMLLMGGFGLLYYLLMKIPSPIPPIVCVDI